MVAGRPGGAARGGLLRPAKPGPFRIAAAAGLASDVLAALGRARGGDGRAERSAGRRPGSLSCLAVDQSRSVAADAAKIVRAVSRRGDGAGQGGPRRLAALCRRARPTGDTTLAADGQERSGHDIAAAITAARAAIPADYVPQIVLFSDGNQTAGDALAAARAAGVPISTVPLPGPEHEVYVAGVAAPAAVRQAGALRRRCGDPIDARRPAPSSFAPDRNAVARSPPAPPQERGGRTSPSTGAKTTSASRDRRRGAGHDAQRAD